MPRKWLDRNRVVPRKGSKIEYYMFSKSTRCEMVSSSSLRSCLQGWALPGEYVDLVPRYLIFSCTYICREHSRVPVTPLSGVNIVRAFDVTPDTWIGRYPWYSSFVEFRNRCTCVRGV